MRTFLFLALLLMAGLANMSAQSKTNSFPGAPELNRMAARFAPTDLQVSVSALSAGDRAALAKLVMAGRIMDDIFLQQYWSGNVALYKKLQKDETPLGKARLNYFWINKSPWSNLDEFKAFLPGVPSRKPEGAGFYPGDMTKEEFEHWVTSLPEKDQSEEL